MRILIQRVKDASVTINEQLFSSIEKGLLLFLGIEDTDTEEDIIWMCNKVVNMRIFPDEQGVMNRSLLETDGNLLVVSQFTLMASTKKGNRPSYIRAAKPDSSIPMYEQVVAVFKSLIGKSVETGVFGADMQVGLTNDGPVTIWLDSKNKE